MKQQEHTMCSNPSLPNSNKGKKAIGEYERKMQFTKSGY
jgi:hypothetical protein